MLDRVLSETSKIPELESVIAEVIEVDVERLVNGRLLVLSRELRAGLFTEKRMVVDIKMAQKIIQLLQRYQAVLVSKRGRIAGIITNTDIGKIFASKRLAPLGVSVFMQVIKEYL